MACWRLRMKAPSDGAGAVLHLPLSSPAMGMHGDGAGEPATCTDATHFDRGCPFARKDQNAADHRTSAPGHRIDTGGILRQRLRAVASVDVTSEARGLSIPVLYLRANEDHLVPESASKIVQSVCPQTFVQEVQGPHCLLQAAPSAAATAVLGFLGGIPRP